MENWKNFVILGLIPGVASLIFSFAIGMMALGGVGFYMLSGSSSSAPAGILMLVAIVLAILLAALSLWFQLAMIKMALVEGKIEVRQSLEDTKTVIWPYFIVMVAAGVLIGLGFVALVIPGIIAAVWFSFVSIIFLEENKRGMDALRASRELVRDYWWPVTGRLFAVVFLIGLISSVFSGVFGGDSESSQQVIGAAFSVVSTPVMALYLVYLYRDLKRVKGEAA